MMVDVSMVSWPHMKTVTLENYRKDSLYPRVVRAVAGILEKQREVAPVDVFAAMDFLQLRDLENWRAGRVPYLEKVIRCNLSKANRVLRILRFHAHDLNLEPIIRNYTHKGKHQLVTLYFSKTAHPGVEEAYRRHFRVFEKTPIRSKKEIPYGTLT